MLFARTRTWIAGNPHYLLFVFAVLILLAGLTNYVVLTHAQASIIEYEAIRIAEVATSQAIASRTVYTDFVANKFIKNDAGQYIDFHDLSDTIPLPAKFLKLVGHEASKRTNLYSYRPLSKWNLEPTQGLKDDFQRWAWRKLEKQEQPAAAAPIEWTPVWRFENVDGVRTLRYMRADPASNMSCVNCHNKFERSPEIFARRVSAGIAPGKQWKQHQLMGAIEANVPVDKVDNIAANQAKTTLGAVLLLSLLAFGAFTVLALRDMRRKHQAAVYFAEQARLDPLTQIGNRMLFQECGKNAIARARATGTQLAVLFIDLDGFKQINDTVGHDAGDAMLKEVAMRLKQCVRVADLVARCGGDEFLILLESVQHQRNVEALVCKLQEAIAKPVPFKEQQLTVGASIGIAYFPEHGSGLDTLLAKADAAMYHVKRSGKNGYCTWSRDL